METTTTQAQENLIHLKSIIDSFKESCCKFGICEAEDFDLTIECIKDGIIQTANTEAPMSVYKPQLLLLNEFMFLIKELTAALPV